MPLGPPEDPERFPDFSTCVHEIHDPPEITRADAREICGKWENQRAAQAIARFRTNATTGGTDPTNTKTLRARYSAEMYRRFRAVKGAIRTGVIDRDVFGLAGRTGAAQTRDFTTAQREFNLPIPQPGEFDFAQDPAKVEAFMRWIDQMVERGILERGELPGGQLVTAHRSWQDTYLRSAYERGVEHADAAMVDAGVIADRETIENVFRVPRHADAAGLLFTRSFNELDGVTARMGQEMGRVLAEGLSTGQNPREIARTMNGRIEGIGIHRGRLIARTETIRAFNIGAINRYESASDRIDGLAVVAEFLTAGDDRVCQECQALEGQVFRLDEARGLIPVHPRCRCTWVPIPAEDRPFTLTENGAARLRAQSRE